MTRISTVQNFNIMTSNLMKAQIRQNDAGTQVSSQKVANDLKGYAKNAEILTAMRGTQTRINGLVEQNKLVNNRLEMQDTGIGQVSDGAKAARDAIANAMAAGTATTLMQELQAAFGNIVQGLNTKSNGLYVFAGAKTDTAPTSVTKMADLTTAPDISDVFHNDDYITTNRVDEQTSAKTGVLADDLGSEVFEIFKAIQAKVDADGPFTGKLDDAQNTFFKDLLKQFEGVNGRIVETQGRNGVTQKRFETASKDLSNQADTLTIMVGGVTDVDMAEAVTRLQAAQLAVQASAQVFSSLQQSSLLNVLRA